MPEPSANVVTWAAVETLRMHRERWHPSRATGSCAQCLPDGSCPQLDWAAGLVGPDPSLDARWPTPGEASA